ncbi:MAG: N-acetyltransferase [Deltaproteobacteria bacterium]|nr:N-acetyltransferase [Deltaproteobacteria bacterium]
MDTSFRHVRTKDAPILSDIYRPYVEETAISFETEPPSATEFTARIEKIASRYPWIVCECQGQVVGYAYASKHRDRAAYRWCVDVAVYLDQNFHGRGLGRRLYERLISELRELGYVNAFAGIAMPNEKSIGLHKSLGFEEVGTYRTAGYKLGRWHDVSWWQLKLRECVTAPAEPRVKSHERTAE